jgi:hypothetical protein
MAEASTPPIKENGEPLNIQELKELNIQALNLPDPESSNREKRADLFRRRTGDSA